MSTECKYAAVCGGGHTSAEHHMYVHERDIKEACGVSDYNDIKAELDELARRRKVDTSTYRIDRLLGGDVWVEYDSGYDVKEVRNTTRHMKTLGWDYRVSEVTTTERLVDVDKL